MFPPATADIAADDRWMARALELANQAVGVSDPNPRVGCVIASTDGQCVGEGHTQRVGEAHAEAMALRDAMQRGADLRQATAYVTLEPCAHHGRTPPCCEALSRAGVARVVAACEDPNPRVRGAGLAHLRAQGIAVQIGPGGEASEALNVGFMKRMRSGLPFVRMKLACSLDGRTALPDGRSQWITGEPARRDGMAWRRRAAALLTGIGTVLADDPRLDVREPEAIAAPLRVVLDRQARLPLDARLLATQGPVLLMHGVDAFPKRLDALRAHGVTCHSLPSNPDEQLHAVLHHLAEQEINELHIKAGAQLSGAWLASGLVDELLVYLAPKLIGPGRPLLELPPLHSLADASSWRWIDSQAFGADLRLRLRPST